MTLEGIREYQRVERNMGREIADRLLRDDHVIAREEAIYPEYELQGPYGLHRPGVNLAALMFFYRHVIAYVPPMTREGFVERFGISYDVFIELAYPSDPADRFILPVLNHPRRYRDTEVRAALGPLLLRMPPTWERWHEALSETGGTRWFEQADALFNYKAMCHLPDLRETWRARLATDSEGFVTKEITQQIRNNYTDLCLVGEEGLANRIAEHSHNDPALAVNELFYASDYLAYPSVMGAGGLANVRARRERPIIPLRDLGLDELRKRVPEGDHFDAEVLEALYEGLEFPDVPQDLRLDFLKEWHKSSQAEEVRAAYGGLLQVARQRNPSMDELHATITAILRQLEEFRRIAEPSGTGQGEVARRRQSRIVSIATAGGLGTTGLGLLIEADIVMAILSGVFTVVGARTWYTQERVTANLLKGFAPDLPPELYESYRELKQFRERYGGAGEALLERTDATSLPVRSYWW